MLVLPYILNSPKVVVAANTVTISTTTFSSMLLT